MPPSAWENRFEVLWTCLVRFNQHCGPKPIGTPWVVGKLDESKGEVVARVETCGRTQQQRLVLMGKGIIIWSVRIAKVDGVWVIVTPNAKGWTHYNRFASIEQIAEQRLAHMNTKERQRGIKATYAVQTAFASLMAVLVLIPILICSSDIISVGAII